MVMSVAYQIAAAGWSTASRAGMGGKWRGGAVWLLTHVFNLQLDGAPPPLSARYHCVIPAACGAKQNHQLSSVEVPVKVLQIQQHRPWQLQLLQPCYIGQTHAWLSIQFPSCSASLD